MNRLSDRIDFIDKVLDLRNYYIESQKQNIANEIEWLETNIENTANLRSYFINTLHMGQAIHFSDEDIKQLAEIRGNNLYLYLCGISQQKVETKPLKFIVQELKHFGQ